MNFDVCIKNAKTAWREFIDKSDPELCIDWSLRCDWEGLECSRLRIHIQVQADPASRVTGLTAPCADNDLTVASEGRKVSGTHRKYLHPDFFRWRAQKSVSTDAQIGDPQAGSQTALEISAQGLAVLSMDQVKKSLLSGFTSPQLLYHQKKFKSLTPSIESLISSNHSQSSNYPDVSVYMVQNSSRYYLGFVTSH